MWSRGVCLQNFRSLKDILANIAKPLMPASRGFDIGEFFNKFFGPLTFKIVLPAMGRLPADFYSLKNLKPILQQTIIHSFSSQKNELKFIADDVKSCIKIV